jgi:diguanylate cyclase (GGDEF)-like protein
MMDLDHFKDVNDTYGHLTGSKTLEEIAYCIITNLRSGDAASRFGGEEFAAFLLDAELPQALVAAERIRSEVERFEFSIVKKNSPGLKHKITISVGISSFPEDSNDPIELVEMADSALYRAKHEGRNTVRAYRDISTAEMKRELPARK